MSIYINSKILFGIVRPEICSRRITSNKDRWRSILMDNMTFPSSPVIDKSRAVQPNSFRFVPIPVWGSKLNFGYVPFLFPSTSISFVHVPRVLFHFVSYCSSWTRNEKKLEHNVTKFSSFISLVVLIILIFYTSFRVSFDSVFISFQFNAVSFSDSLHNPG